MLSKTTTFLLVAAIAVATLLAVHHESPHDEYLQWKTKFAVVFSPNQDNYRRLIFLENLNIIEKHNQDSIQTYKMGLNQFSALTDDEFRATYLMNIPRQEKSNEGIIVEEQEGKERRMNGEVDWTERGMVSPVKNQGQCGSCWAFSAVAVLESFALFKGQKVDLSEQQLVDCSHLYGNMGCDGGFNTEGLAYVRDHGITQTANYPYVAKNQLCKVHGGDFKFSQLKSVKGCSNLQQAVLGRPVGVGVDASNWSKYSSGIFSNCGKHIDHNVLLVGISSTAYKIKNSWTTSWGEKGFIRLAPGNTCGICDDKSPWVE